MVGNLHSKITIHYFRIQINVNMFYVVFSSKVYFFLHNSSTINEIREKKLKCKI